MNCLSARIWTTIAALLTTSALAAEPSKPCPEGSVEQLAQELKIKPATELAFFASWCASCKQHLLEAGDETIFIASFDQQDAVNAVVKVLRGERRIRCFWDKDDLIAKHYKVRSLPVRRKP